MEFSKNGTLIELSKTEQKLLRILIENIGITLTRAQLVDLVWTNGAEYVDENALSVTIKRLRDKLEDSPSSPKYIKTVYGIGYTWTVKVMEKLDWICVIAAVTVMVCSITIIFLYRKRTQQIMEKLNTMLDSAINGDFSESVFDESALSAVEAKMARFLSSCAVSSKNLTKEKRRIKGLISDISHQTKTPIANILLYSQLLSEHELPADCAVCVKALSTQAEKLNFLIGVLVKISRLETGIITVNPKEEVVQKLLDAVVSQIKPESEAKEIAFVIEPVNSTAFFDSKWTTEAVYNIIDNAVKYSPAQSTIKIKVLPYDMFCRIDIADEGIGIAEEEQSKIFSRFYRSAAVGEQEGVGIGLFLAREIISSGGGYMKVSSKPGQGSIFSVFLPTQKR